MFIVFTDLDGTLLDHDTYSYAEAEEGICILKEKGYPLVLVSSKTLPEMRLLHAELSLETPIIFENGGGIAFKTKNPDKFEIEYAGLSADELTGKLGILATIMGSRIFPITEMSVREVAEFTGLDATRAELAKKRLASIPFIVDEMFEFTIDDLNRFNSILNKKDLHVTKGGRFYHVMSSNAGKGTAVRKIVDWYKRSGSKIVATAGIGDSENDISMLETVERPFLVRKKNGTFIKTEIGNIAKTEKAGPAGFTEAVKKICS